MFVCVERLIEEKMDRQVDRLTCIYTDGWMGIQTTYYIQTDR